MVRRGTGSGFIPRPFACLPDTFASPEVLYEYECDLLDRSLDFRLASWLLVCVHHLLPVLCLSFSRESFSMLLIVRLLA